VQLRGEEDEQALDHGGLALECGGLPSGCRDKFASDRVRGREVRPEEDPPTFGRALVHDATNPVSTALTGAVRRLRSHARLMCQTEFSCHDGAPFA
jgi:hypothetical protein